MSHSKLRSERHPERRIKLMKMKYKRWEETGGRCEVCGTALPIASMDFHHKHLRSRGGEDTEENLELLCRPCHEERHSQAKHRFKEGTALLPRKL